MGTRTDTVKHMHTCIHMYIYVQTHTCTPMYVLCTCRHPSAYKYCINNTYANTYTSMCTNNNIYIHAPGHRKIVSYIHQFTCKHGNTCANIHARSIMIHESAS